MAKTAALIVLFCSLSLTAALQFTAGIPTVKGFKEAPKDAQEGATAEFDEAGYQEVTRSVDSGEQMVVFARRLLDSEDLQPTDDKLLRDFVEWYSGEKSVQTFERLMREIVLQPFVLAKPFQVTTHTKTDNGPIATMFNTNAAGAYDATKSSSSSSSSSSSLEDVNDSPDLVEADDARAEALSTAAAVDKVSTEVAEAEEIDAQAEASLKEAAEAAEVKARAQAGVKKSFAFGNAKASATMESDDNGNTELAPAGSDLDLGLSQTHSATAGDGVPEGTELASAGSDLDQTMMESWLREIQANSTTKTNGDGDSDDDGELVEGDGVPEGTELASAGSDLDLGLLQTHSATNGDGDSDDDGELVEGDGVPEGTELASAGSDLDIGLLQFSANKHSKTKNASEVKTIEFAAVENKTHSKSVAAKKEVQKKQVQKDTQKAFDAQKNISWTAVPEDQSLFQLQENKSMELLNELKAKQENLDQMHQKVQQQLSAKIEVVEAQAQATAASVDTENTAQAAVQMENTIQLNGSLVEKGIASSGWEPAEQEEWMKPQKNVAQKAASVVTNAWKSMFRNSLLAAKAHTQALQTLVANRTENETASLYSWSPTENQTAEQMVSALQMVSKKANTTDAMDVETTVSSGASATGNATMERVNTTVQAKATASHKVSTSLIAAKARNSASAAAHKFGKKLNKPIVTTTDLLTLSHDERTQLFDAFGEDSTAILEAAPLGDKVSKELPVEMIAELIEAYSHVNASERKDLSKMMTAGEHCGENCTKSETVKKVVDAWNWNETVALHGKMHASVSKQLKAVGKTGKTSKTHASKTHEGAISVKNHASKGHHASNAEASKADASKGHHGDATKSHKGHKKALKKATKATKLKCLSKCYHDKHAEKAWIGQKCSWSICADCMQCTPESAKHQDTPETVLPVIEFDDDDEPDEFQIPEGNKFVVTASAAKSWFSKLTGFGKQDEAAASKSSGEKEVRNPNGSIRTVNNSARLLHTQELRKKKEEEYRLPEDLLVDESKSQSLMSLEDQLKELKDQLKKSDTETRKAVKQKKAELEEGLHTQERNITQLVNGNKHLDILVDKLLKQNDRLRRHAETLQGDGGVLRKQLAELKDKLVTANDFAAEAAQEGDDTAEKVSVLRELEVHEAAEKNMKVRQTMMLEVSGSADEEEEEKTQKPEKKKHMALFQVEVKKPEDKDDKVETSKLALSDTVASFAEHFATLDEESEVAIQTLEEDYENRSVVLSAKAESLAAKRDDLLSKQQEQTGLHKRLNAAVKHLTEGVAMLQERVKGLSSFLGLVGKNIVVEKDDAKSKKQSAVQLRKVHPADQHAHLTKQHKALQHHEAGAPDIITFAGEKKSDIKIKHNPSPH